MSARIHSVAVASFVAPTVVGYALWFSLFLHEHLPMLAWLQMSFLLLCAYGLVRWALVQRSRIGYLGTTLARSGVALAAGVFVWSIVAYWRMPGHALSTWWWVEARPAYA